VKKILFRADAKSSIGTGDLVSLITLSKYFIKNGWECFFLIKEYSTAIKILESRGIYGFNKIAKDISLKNEIKTINNFVKDNSINVSVFQQFEINFTEYRDLTNQSFNIAISGNEKISSIFSMVISWDNKAIELIKGNMNKNTEYLLGSEYAILPIEFEKEKINKRIYSKIPKKVLITMGGCDEFNITKKIIIFFSNAKYEFKLNIILGGGYQFLDELEYFLKRTELDYTIKHNVTNIYEEFINTDFAISAGGLTLYELLATKTPTISIATVEHQITRCEYFNNSSLIYYFGYQSIDNITLTKFMLNYGTIVKNLKNNYNFKTSDIVKELEKKAFSENI